MAFLDTGSKSWWCEMKNRRKLQVLRF